MYHKLSSKTIAKIDAFVKAYPKDGYASFVANTGLKVAASTFSRRKSMLMKSNPGTSVEVTEIGGVDKILKQKLFSLSDSDKMDYVRAMKLSIFHGLVANAILKSNEEAQKMLTSLSRE